MPLQKRSLQLAWRNGAECSQSADFAATELKEMQGYLTLGEYLGKLYYQLEKAAVEKVEIIYTGEVAEMETGMLTRAVLKGVFEPILKERVNYVNAALTAESRGVEL